MIRPKDSAPFLQVEIAAHKKIGWRLPLVRHRSVLGKAYSDGLTTSDGNHKKTDGLLKTVNAKLRAQSKPVIMRAGLHMAGRVLRSKRKARVHSGQ